MQLPYLLCGKIINTHGFRGAVKAESFCDTPEILSQLKTLFVKERESYRASRVLHASVFKQFVIFELEGITDEAAAERMRGTELYAAREALPLEEGSYFIMDLLGIDVLHADTGAHIGTLKDINTSGVRDLYVIRTARGESLVPAVPEFIVKIDPDDAVYIRPIPGLIDGEEA